MEEESAGYSEKRVSHPRKLLRGQAVETDGKDVAQKRPRAPALKVTGCSLGVSGPFQEAGPHSKG